MTEQIEEIEQEIDETKASLIGKLEALENQVAEAVQATTESVSETVGAVKQTVDTVKEKVRDAGEFLNLRRQAENNPWTVFSSSIVVGCLAGYMLGDGKRKKSVDEAQTPLADDASRPQLYTEPKQEKPSWFREQVGNLSSLAIATAMGALRDLAESKLPDEIGKRVSQEVDRFTTSLGAKPIAGPILPRLEEWLAPKTLPVAGPPIRRSAG